jgi:hypothetical protein
MERAQQYTSIARQLISKHASLRREAVFSAWSMQSGYKEVFSRSSRVRDASLPGCELRIEVSRIATQKKKKGIRL